jgi:hypothetical protein
MQYIHPPSCTVSLGQADCHRDEIGHHVVVAQEGNERLHQVGELARAALDDFPVNRL